MSIYIYNKNEWIKNNTRSRTRSQKTQTAIEINGQPERQDLFDIHAHRAKELGVPLALTTDAHATHQLAYMEIAISVARRGWLEKRDIINTLSTKEILEWLEN